MGERVGSGEGRVVYFARVAREDAGFGGLVEVGAGVDDIWEVAGGGEVVRLSSVIVGLGWMGRVIVFGRGGVRGMVVLAMARSAARERRRRSLDARMRSGVEAASGTR